jgi:Uri superfamily endonuclease
MTGIYFIIASLNKDTNLKVKSGRAFVLAAGFYGYIGSALGGLEQRVSRHLRATKKYHWHIDYLLNYARVEEVICAETKKKKECSIARALARSLRSVPGFGCSDCNCPSHLFFSDDKANLKNRVISIFKQLGLCHKVLFP